MPHSGGYQFKLKPVLPKVILYYLIKKQ